jgi:hypothetical protein
MQYTTIEEIHKSPWGIVARRRKEIERGAYGVFDKVLAEEIDKQFPTAKMAAKIMVCSESTARRWLQDSDSRFIVHEGITRFCRDDVVKVTGIRNAKIQERAAKKEKAA